VILFLKIIILRISNSGQNPKMEQERNMVCLLELINAIPVLYGMYGWLPVKRRSRNPLIELLFREKRKQI
jgi:hypothetical protein